MGSLVPAPHAFGATWAYPSQCIPRYNPLHSDTNYDFSAFRPAHRELDPGSLASRFAPFRLALDGQRAGPRLFATILTPCSPHPPTHKHRVNPRKESSEKSFNCRPFAEHKCSRMSQADVGRVLVIWGLLPATGNSMTLNKGGAYHSVFTPFAKQGNVSVGFCCAESCFVLFHFRLFS